MPSSSHLALDLEIDSDFDLCLGPPQVRKLVFVTRDRSSVWSLYTVVRADLMHGALEFKTWASKLQRTGLSPLPCGFGRGSSSDGIDQQPIFRHRDVKSLASTEAVSQRPSTHPSTLLATCPAASAMRDKLAVATVRLRVFTPGSGLFTGFDEV
ncbi:hypothetical protein LZ554_002389 [Drepanopeziza brunnea f. sp. 'monogermtubi']|nr:hypothetical protein LZ554_002389 [Drepanopeziza brunnea f. sp. 'monogermtubi']